eukprot:Gb_33347 [translate_table: standard]
MMVGKFVVISKSQKVDRTKAKGRHAFNNMRCEVMKPRNHLGLNAHNGRLVAARRKLVEAQSPAKYVPMLPLRGLWCSDAPISLPSIFLLLCAIMFASAQADNDSHTSFIFNQFNDTSELVLIENASILHSRVLRLTNNSHWMLGRALYPNPVQIKNNNTLLSFSTTFVFSMVHPPSDEGGHGIAFIMTPYKSLRGAVAAEYLGLLNLSSNGQLYNHLFAVEFDTSKNVEFEDIDDNHVGVDLNNLQSVESRSAGYWVNENEFRRLSLKSGQNIQVWIDYDHLQNKLNVSITVAGFPRPQKPLISLKNIDLSSVLQDQMYMGFSAATGNFVEDHYILAWSFTTSGTTAPPLDLSHLPSFAPIKSKYESPGFIAGVTVASVVLVFLAIISVLRWLKAMKYREFIEEWELEYWPHRFSYKELSIATKGFRDEEVLGSGGFGKVYKGLLPSSGLNVAVKCITREFTEGMKGFIAEISSMGQTVLRWAQRYTILKDVAAGLLYLHEQWEQRVIHRDIKSSNVLLDSELNGRLGDFGLARLYDHSENPQTTHVVGTLGYIAPELIHTGKATPSADLFGFGALMLEVACGRKPVDPSMGTEEVVLVDWVWELYAKEKLLDAVDPKLGGEYDVEEMERVLKLGLICSHPEPEGRLSARQVLQILEGQSPLPILHTPSLNVSIMGNTPRSLYVCTADLMSYGATSRSHSERSSITRWKDKAGQIL